MSEKESHPNIEDTTEESPYWRKEIIKEVTCSGFKDGEPCGRTLRIKGVAGSGDSEVRRCGNCGFDNIVVF